MVPCHHRPANDARQVEMRCSLAWRMVRGARAIVANFTAASSGHYRSGIALARRAEAPILWQRWGRPPVRRQPSRRSAPPPTATVRLLLFSPPRPSGPALSQGRDDIIRDNIPYRVLPACANGWPSSMP
jgi:hypothetical protein